MATTIPVTVIPNRATNLKNINMSPILVPSFVDMQFSRVTANKPNNATPLLIQALTFSASAPIAALTRYSPMIIDIMAVEPGFNTITAHHVNKNPNNSPNIFDRYTCAPPFKGIAPPNSAYEEAPVHASMPAIAHTINAAPGDPAFALTWLGLENMPDPIINPTINDNPFRYVNVLCFSRLPPPNAVCPSEAEIGAPIGAYPFPVVEDRGNRFEEKSKAEETDNVRPWAPGRPFAAGFRASSGSSSSRESFREEDMPDREEVEDVEVRGPGELDARLASSRESRAWGWRLEYGDIISSLRKEAEN
jgi:hypothetical protein